MIAVAGFPKAFPPAAYDFAGGGLIETRFRDIKWFEADYRVRWRWDNEALFEDVDGTFVDQPFCAGCSVLNNGLVRDTRAFPECYHDWRYHGPICKPPLEFVSVAFDVPFDRLEFAPLYVRYHMRRDTADFYVNEDDADYMRDLWRPRNSYNLVHMDAAMGRRACETRTPLRAVSASRHAAAHHYLPSPLTWPCLMYAQRRSRPPSLGCTTTSS